MALRNAKVLSTEGKRRKRKPLPWQLPRLEPLYLGGREDDQQAAWTLDFPTQPLIVQPVWHLQWPVMAGFPNHPFPWMETLEGPIVAAVFAMSDAQAQSCHHVRHLAESAYTDPLGCRGPWDTLAADLLFRHLVGGAVSAYFDLLGDCLIDNGEIEGEEVGGSARFGILPVKWRGSARDWKHSWSSLARGLWWAGRTGEGCVAGLSIPSHLSYPRLSFEEMFEDVMSYLWGEEWGQEEQGEDTAQ